MSFIKNEYCIILIFLIFSIILTLIILIVSYVLTQQKPYVEKLSSYECGFEPYENARHVIDVKFVLTAILFIVFDIEIMFLVPWTTGICKLDLLSFWSMIDFIIELMIGLFYVYCVKALDWD